MCIFTPFYISHLGLFPNAVGDGTFDILKFADPELDLDIDEQMLANLDFMEDEKANAQGLDIKKEEAKDRSQDR